MGKTLKKIDNHDLSKLINSSTDINIKYIVDFFIKKISLLIKNINNNNKNIKITINKPNIFVNLEIFLNKISKILDEELLVGGDGSQTRTRTRSRIRSRTRSMIDKLLVKYNIIFGLLLIIYGIFNLDLYGKVIYSYACSPEMFIKNAIELANLPHSVKSQYIKQVEDAKIKTCELETYKKFYKVMFDESYRNEQILFMHKFVEQLAYNTTIEDMEYCAKVGDLTYITNRPNNSKLPNNSKQVTIQSNNFTKFLQQIPNKRDDIEELLIKLQNEKNRLEMNNEISFVEKIFRFSHKAKDTVTDTVNSLYKGTQKIGLKAASTPLSVKEGIKSKIDLLSCVAQRRLTSAEFSAKYLSTLIGQFHTNYNAEMANSYNLYIWGIRSIELGASVLFSKYGYKFLEARSTRRGRTYNINENTIHN